VTRRHIPEKMSLPITLCYEPTSYNDGGKNVIEMKVHSTIFFLIFMDPCIVVWLRINNQQDATL
jgi:hypothetical protein